MERENMNMTKMYICRMLRIVQTMLVLAASLVVAQDLPEVKQWQVYEVKMTAARNEGNPYVTYFQDRIPPRVTVRFTGTSAEAAGREITVAGFWDGGLTWKARFAPPATAEWVFESHSEDLGLDGVTGKFTCTE